MFQRLSFRSQKLEERFWQHQSAYIEHLPRRLQICAATWCLWCVLETAGLLRLSTALLGLALVLGLQGLGLHCLAHRRRHDGWAVVRVPVIALATTCLVPLLVRHRAASFGDSALPPGHTVVVLAWLLARDQTAHCSCRSRAACDLIAFAVMIGATALQLASFPALLLPLTMDVALWIFGCYLRQGLERMRRELFLLQYRAAAKAQHFRLLMGCLLPAQIVEPYFERCIKFEGGGLIAAPLAQRASCAGVLFIAIDAFDQMTISESPLELLQFLNRLFTAFDLRCEQASGLVKIETVGEVYVAASGLFRSIDEDGESKSDGELFNNDKSDSRDCNLQALAEFALWSRTAASELGVRLRMGLHCGPLVAGIVGDKLPRFRLFGDTVNTAARLEQHCPPSWLLASEDAAELVRASRKFQIHEHRTLPMKGLGEILTFQIDHMDSISPCTLCVPLQSQAVFMRAMEAPDLAATPESPRTGNSTESTAESSANLANFLMSLPELDEAEPTQAAACDVFGISPLRTPIKTPGKTPKPWPVTPMTPLWEYLEHGLADPACIEAERYNGEVPQPEDVVVRPFSEPCLWHGAEVTIRSPAFVTSALRGARQCSPETPTSWLSPGKQLQTAHRSGSMSAVLGRCPATPALPTVSEGSGSSDVDDPPDLQLEELRRRTNEACEWSWSLWHFLGTICFRDESEETRFCESCFPRARCAVRCTANACLASCVPFVITGRIFDVPGPSSRLTVWSAIIALLTCAWTSRGASAATRQRAVQMATLACLGPVALAWACALRVVPVPTMISDMVPWVLMAGVVHSQLPCSGLLVLGLAASALVSCNFATLSLATLGHTIAIVALACVGLAQENLARRAFASERVCDEVLSRLRVVAEDLLPPSVVAEMRQRRFGGVSLGEDAWAMPGLVVHRYDCVSILQTDLVGFTAVARTLQPEEVLGMLNELFVVFDRLVGVHGVFKMETVGDAYICASGLPDFGRGEHMPQALLQLALDMHAAVGRHSQRMKTTMGLRAGIHAGPAIGGVVGSTMQRYHLFGSTVRTAEALEATSPNGAVHLSEAARRALAKAGALPLRSGAGGERLVLEPTVPEARLIEKEQRQEHGLCTSKGEFVPMRQLGSLGTFVVWPPSAHATGTETTCFEGAAHARFTQRPQSPHCGAGFGTPSEKPRPRSRVSLRAEGGS